jgi:hypothetical protein
VSIPPSVPVDKLLARLFKAARGLSDTDVAARWVVARSYVTQLRSGALTPGRMGAARRARLVALVEELEAGFDSAKVAAGGRAEFYDGVLFAAQAMSETVTKLLADARAGLKSGAPRSLTPTAGEIVVGLDALDRVEAATPGASAAPKRRRGG